MQIKQIREKNLVGTLFQPDLQEALPGIILVPGADGGIPEAFAERLTLQGYAVFALGYFGLENLPTYLENIHLEYFQKAMQWFKALPQINENRLGFIGYSRGGELALLVGSMFPESINAIIAYVPNSIVCGGSPHPNKPAWLYNNKPILPFLSGLMNKEENLTDIEDLILANKAGKIPFHKNTEEDPYEFRELFIARNNQDNILKAAAIPVENILCPLLILSGEEDKIWPSSLYGELIMERLDQKKSSIERKHMHFPNAGHILFEICEDPNYEPAEDSWFTLGGTAEGNAFACQESWQEILKFLKKNLQGINGPI